VLKNSLIIIISLFLTIFSLEILTRVFFIDELIPLGEHVIYKKGSRGYKENINKYIFLKNKLGYMHNPKNPDFNQYGIFTKNIRNLKNPYKILILGDSVTDPTEYCTYPDGYTFELEKILKNKLKKSFQILVSGCVGYNTEQEAIYLEKFGKYIKPNMIILGFINNDFDISQKYEEYNDRIEVGYKRPASIPIFFDLGRFNYYLYENFYFVRFLCLRANQLLSNSHKVKKFFNPSYEANVNSLYRIKKISDTLGARLLIVHFPYFRNFNSYKKDHVWKTHQLVRSFCQKENIEYLDLFNTFKKYDPKELCMEDPQSKDSIPTHPNKFGHNLAGQALAKYLLKNNLLK